jgi:YVTN family beta-propeller protein
VYTADQDSNTVTVIDPKTTTVLGTIPLGRPRMDTDADVLGAMYDGQIDVHGLGFSRDGQYLNVVDATTNAVHVIDTALFAGSATIGGEPRPDESKPETSRASVEFARTAPDGDDRRARMLLASNAELKRRRPSLTPLAHCGSGPSCGR